MNEILRIENNVLKEVVDKSITKLVIPEGVISIIGDEEYNLSTGRNCFKYVFEDCHQIEEIILPSTLEFFTINTFEPCFKLKSIIVSDSNKSYTSVDGVLFNKDITKLIAYPMNKDDESYIIPSTVKEIGVMAFLSSENLVNLVLPDNLECIRRRAFWGSKKLKEVNIPNLLSNISYDIFSGCESLEAINVNTNSYKSVDGVLYTADLKELIYYPQNKKDTKYKLLDTTIKIAEEAFEYCPNLKEVVLNEGLKIIDDRNFTRCKFTIINIPSTLEVCGYEFLSVAKNLESITVDKNNKVFKSVDGVLFTHDLKTLLLYPSAKKDKSYTITANIADNAFMICSNLEEVIIKEGVQTIGIRNFSFCGNMKRIDVPASVNFINLFALDIGEIATINLSKDNKHYKLVDNKIFEY